MSPWLIGAGVGAVAGALKYKGDKERAAEERAQAANTVRYSGWTGKRPDRMYVPEPSLIGNIAQGALGGASFGLMNWDSSGNRLVGKNQKVLQEGTAAEAGTDSSSVGGAGLTSPSAQKQVETDNLPLYQSSKGGPEDQMAYGPLADPPAPTYPYGMQPGPRSTFSPWHYYNIGLERNPRIQGGNYYDTSIPTTR